VTLHDWSQRCRCFAHEDGEVAVAGVAYDSRRLQPGSLFVAIRGC
jgi:UDP-N-acetylmuramyl pentapeptide synthase